MLRHGKYKIVVKQFLQLKNRTLNKPEFNWSGIFDENLLLLLLWPTKFVLKIENVEWKTNHLFLCNLVLQGQNASIRNCVKNKCKYSILKLIYKLVFIDKTVNYIFVHPRLAATSTKSCLSPKNGIYFLELFYLKTVCLNRLWCKAK